MPKPLPGINQFLTRVAEYWAACAGDPQGQVMTATP